MNLRAQCVQLTFKQVIAAVLQQAVDVQRDEELGPQGVSVQIRRQGEGDLQNRNQQEAAGGGFPVPALDLREKQQAAQRRP